MTREPSPRHPPVIFPVILRDKRTVPPSRTPPVTHNQDALTPSE